MTGPAAVGASGKNHSVARLMPSLKIHLQCSFCARLLICSGKYFRFAVVRLHFVIPLGIFAKAAKESSRVPSKNRRFFF